MKVAETEEQSGLDMHQPHSDKPHEPWLLWFVTAGTISSAPSLACRLRILYAGEISHGLQLGS